MKLDAELDTKNSNSADPDDANKESNAADHNNSNKDLNSDHSDVVLKTTNDQEITEPVPDANASRAQPIETAIESETATVPTTNAINQRYSLRPNRTRSQKLESHSIIHDTSQLTDDQKD